MAVIVDCWMRDSVDHRQLPAQVGNAICRWRSATAGSSATGGPNPRCADLSSDQSPGDSVTYWAWFDTVHDFEASLDTFERGIEHLSTHPESAAVWLVSASDPWSWLLFGDQPATWASLCLGPAHPVQVVVRPSALDPAGWSTDQTDPGWMATVALWLREQSIATLLPQTGQWDQLPVDRLPPLTPTPSWGARAGRRDWLQVHLATLAHRETSDPCDQAALQAGVWQCLGELDLSHRLSQQHEGQGTNQLCDYWHAIMHRREPDYANSKYWFRQLGRHPAFTPLSERAAKLLANAAPQERAWERRLLRGGTWDPFGMVDLAQAAAENQALDPLARRLQALELSVLWGVLLRQVRSSRGN